MALSALSDEQKIGGVICEIVPLPFPSTAQKLSGRSLRNSAASISFAPTENKASFSGKEAPLNFFRQDRNLVVAIFEKVPAIFCWRVQKSGAEVSASIFCSGGQKLAGGFCEITGRYFLSSETEISGPFSQDSGSLFSVRREETEWSVLSRKRHTIFCRAQGKLSEQRVGQ